MDKLQTYIIQIVIVSIISFISVHPKLYRVVDCKIIPNKYFVWLLIVFLVFISGFREITYNTIGNFNDEYRMRLYFNSLINMPFDITGLNIFNEPGKYISFWLLANITKNSQWFVFMYALVTNVLIVKSFSKYCGRYFPLATFLYIAGGFYMSSMNLITQYLAASIIFNSFTYLINRNPFKFMINVLIATTFHVSAIIMIPLYYIFSKPLKKKYIFISLMLVFLMAPIIVNFSKFLLTDTLYSSYTYDMDTRGEGVKLIRVLAWLVPYTLLFISNKKLFNKENENNIFLYQVLLSAMTLILSGLYLYFYRLNVYFSLYSLVPVSQIPQLIQNRYVRFMLKVLMIVMFFVFGMYQYLIGHKYSNIFFL